MHMKIIVLEEVLNNVKNFETKEQIIDEIQSMIEESIVKLHEQEIEQLKDSIEFCRCNGMDEEAEEFEEMLNDMVGDE